MGFCAYAKCLAGLGAGAAESLLNPTPSERIKTTFINEESDKKQLKGGLLACHTDKMTLARNQWTELSSFIDAPKLVNESCST